MAMAGIATGIGVGVGYGVLSEYAKLAMLTAKWKLIGWDVKQTALASVLQQIVVAEKDKVTGLSAKGAVDVIRGFLDKTIDLAWMLDEGLAQQMFVQMIQQSVAYAIHASHAGSIGTVTNVYSGSVSPASSLAQAINQATDMLDRKHRGFLNASMGMNLPFVASEVVRGANSRLDAYLQRIMTDSEGIIGQWNDLLMTYYSQYSTLAHTRYVNAVTMKEDVVTRAYSILESVGQEHLKRINELLDSLEGANNWYTSGFLSADEFIEITVRIELERQASEKVYDEYKTAIDNSIANAILTWDDKITQGYNDLTDMELSWKSLVASIMSPIVMDTLNFAGAIIAVCDKVITDVGAYRNTVPPISVMQMEGFEHAGYLGEIDYVYLQYGGSPYTIYYCKFGGTPVSVSTVDDPYSMQDNTGRKLARDNYGTLYCVYVKKLATKKQIYVKRSTDGGVTWANETLISTYAGMSGQDQMKPCITIDSLNNVHVVWYGVATGYTAQQIWYAKYDGSVWTAPTCLSTVAGMDTHGQYDPVITINWLDRPNVVWYGTSTTYGTYNQIWATRYTGSAWSTPARLSTVAGMDGKHQYRPTIAMDSHNYLHVTWHGASTSYALSQVWYTKYTTSWSTPARISTLTSMENYEQSNSCIAVDSTDFIHVTWKGVDVNVSPHYHIYYAKYVNSWSTPVRISTQPTSETDENLDPSVTVDSDDTIYILWSALKIPTEVPNYIYYSMYRGEWSVPLVLQSGNPYDTPNLRRVRRF